MLISFLNPFLKLVWREGPFRAIAVFAARRDVTLFITKLSINPVEPVHMPYPQFSFPRVFWRFPDKAQRLGTAVRTVLHYEFVEFRDGYIKRMVFLFCGSSVVSPLLFKKGFA